MTNLPRQSLSRRMMVMILLIILLVLAGASVVFGVSRHEKASFTSQINVLRNKQKIADDINGHVNQIFFHARGFLAFGNPAEYDLAVAEEKQLESAMASFRELPLDDKEKELLTSLDLYFKDYFTETLPRGDKAAQMSDMDALKMMAGAGVTRQVDDLVSNMADLSLETDKQVQKAYEKLLTAMIDLDTLFVCYIIAILLIFTLAAGLTIRGITHPLRALADTAEKLATGDPAEPPSSDRKDEIGQLARSFRFMMQVIQAKEEELTSQNEELQAQQVELQQQQEQLQEALRQTEENERRIERRHQLVQSLANTLDKQDLLQSMVRGMAEVLTADKGMIVLLNERLEHAAFGISEEGAVQFVKHIHEGLLQRILQTKRPYVVSREAEAHERGYHPSPMQAHDLYLPVLTAEGVVTACLTLTRIGVPFRTQESDEAVLLAAQISLALDKLFMYETTENQRQQTQDILNTIHEGVQLVDDKGTLVDANNTLYELFGVKREGSAAGLPIERFFAYIEDKVEQGRQLIDFMSDGLKGKPAVQGAPYLYELTYPVRRMIQVYVEPLRRGEERLGTLFVHRDMTKEYEVDQMKSEFVSTVSHELRTPLSSVLGFAELLMTKDLKPERQRKYLSTIHQEATRLTKLINDFLDVQRMESGKQTYHKQPVVISDIVHKVAERLSERAPLHEFVFESSDSSPLLVYGDSDKLVQAFMNLIGNAVKYSPHGGEIAIRCRLGEGRVTVEVSDEGLGIPREAMPRLFTKFYRIDNSDRREIGGTGLGLAIVKEIVEAHGGVVRVESEYGRGSTFTVDLPEYRPGGLEGGTAGDSLEAV